MASVNETIAAIATPAGRGGVGIIRVSGPDAASISKQLCGTLPAPRQAVFRRFRDADDAVIDEGLVLYFPAPHSFTGEEVLELHGHGGPVVMDALLARVCALGARPARPGEFSERAFLNDKLDLAQAEAIADLIDAGSRQAARAALRSLDGVFSNEVNRLAEAMLELRLYVEAAIDFPEEEIDFLADEKVTQRVAALQQDLAALLHRAEQGARLREGLTLVIAGAPNAGKSSLMNALAGRETAIVTEIPGTTRDVLREQIVIDGLPVHVIDTAGLREAGDVVEQEGIRRARREIERADRVLLVQDATTPPATIALPEGLPVTTVINKVDISGDHEGEHDGAFYLSAKTGRGIDVLIQHLKRSAGLEDAAEDSFSARRRHLDALRRAQGHVAQGKAVLEATRAGELLAEELRLAHDALGEITGKLTADDLLGAIFSSFCIGK
ncbi:MAG: tRNA uridine-5-carboxymethylaminomethyl(34) synthesis GTPase MnmE [Granulosicoccaceae bacterium]|jgi:tRNA modification GTPase